MADAREEGHERLLDETNGNAILQMQQADEATPPGLPDAEHKHLCRRLYISHALSAWNSRLFEFGAFLFLANIYPNTLLPASVYALARAASAALLSPWLGSYIDRADRLRAVRLSIRMHPRLCCNMILLTPQSRSTSTSNTVLRWLPHLAYSYRMGTIKYWQDSGSAIIIHACLHRKAELDLEHHLSGARLGNSDSGE